MRPVDHLEHLSMTLPQRIRAARQAGLETVRITLAEAEAVRTVARAALTEPAETRISQHRRAS